MKKLNFILFVLSILFLSSCNSIKIQEKFNGTWQSLHKGGGDTMHIKNNKLEYIARSCTDPDEIYKNINYSIDGDVLKFHLPLPYNRDFKFNLKSYKGNFYLLSDYEIKQMEIKKDDYWYTRGFKKINKTMNK